MVELAVYVFAWFTIGTVATAAAVRGLSGLWLVGHILLVAACASSVTAVAMHVGWGRR